MCFFFVITHTGVREFILIELEPQAKRSIACYKKIYLLSLYQQK